MCQKKLVRGKVVHIRSTGPETSALAEDLIDALCGLLLLPFMPATALWHIGWLLRQLLPASPGGGPRLTDQQCGLLESAMRLSRQFLMAELNGADSSPTTCVSIHQMHAAPSC